MTSWTWNLMKMKTLKPDVDCDPKMFDISEIRTRSLWIKQHIDVQRTAAACYADFRRHQRKCYVWKKGKTGNWDVASAKTRKRGKRFHFLIRRWGDARMLQHFCFDKINIFILFRRHFNPISSASFVISSSACSFFYFRLRISRDNVFLSFPSHLTQIDGSCSRITGRIWQVCRRLRKKPMNRSKEDENLRTFRGTFLQSQTFEWNN